MALEPCINRAGNAHHEWRMRPQGAIWMAYCIYCLQEETPDKGREAMKAVVEAQSKPPAVI